MNIKVNNQYLDFNGKIDIDRQVKLFDESGEAIGDVSYDFTVPDTSKNNSIFQLFSIDQSGKTIYSKIPAVLESSGAPVYFGFIKVGRCRDGEIECTFFSGNSSFFSILDFKLKDFDFSSFNVEWTFTSISARETATTGIIFPVINTGAMTSRSYPNWQLDDMHPFIYTHTVIKYLLNRNGIKLEGDILNDWRFNHLITSNNSAGQPQEEINNRSTSVGKTIDQSIGTSPTKVTFHLETDPYYVGDLWDTSTDRYTADYKSVVDITVSIEIDSGSEFMHFYIFKNGTEEREIFGDTATSNGNKTINNYPLEPGDYIEFYADVESGTGSILSYYLTIKPVRLYNVFTQYLLPDVTAKEFVSSVFELFNPVINFNAVSKTVTVNLFKRVIRNSELDISQYIDSKSIETDFSELMENYGKLNNFLYSESDTEAAEKYNNNNVLPYGSGQIDSENELSVSSSDIISSLFIATAEDNKNPLSSFLPVLNWRSLDESSELSNEGVSLTNSSGLIFTASGYTVGDVVRVYNSTNEAYNGEWIVSSATSTTFRVAGLTYIGNATADIVKLDIIYESTEEQALLLALPNISINSFSNLTLMYYADASGVNGAASPATAYFHKPLQGLDVDDYKESLSFGDVEIINAHQISILQSYWRDFEMIIKDPVKVMATAHFPKPVFNKLFDGPLRLKTNKFNTKFFCNKVTGYESSHLPCEVELIKISAHSQSLTYTEGPAPTPEPEYDEDLQDVLDFAEQEDYTLPSDEVIELLDDLITELKNLGVWEDLDLLYIFSTDGDEDFATLNLVNPATFKASMVNSVTWIPGSGFQGDGIDGYLNTGWDPATNAVHYTLNEGGAFAYSATNDGAPSGTSLLFGTRNGFGTAARIHLAPKNASSLHVFGLNSNGVASVGSSVSAQGFFHLSRIASNDIKLFKNGSQVGATQTTATDILNNDNLYILAASVNEVPGDFSSETIGVFGIGASFAGKESELNDIFNTFTEAVELLPAGAFLLEDDSGFITLENDTDLLIKVN